MPSLQRASVSIHYDDIGEARPSEPPLVMLHSFLCDNQMWQPQVEALSGEHRLINLDHRGHGRSGHAREPFTLYDMLDDTLAVLDDLGVERAVWAGLSIGGMVAMRAAVVAPERVAGLALVSTHAEGEQLWKAIKYRSMAAAVRVVGVRPLTGAVMPLMFGKTTRAENRELVAEWRERMAALDPRSIARGLGALLGRRPILGELSRVDVPTVVIAGEEDKAHPVEFSQRIHQAIVASRYVEIPRCGHLCSLEVPEPVTEALRELMGAVMERDRGP